MGRYTTLEWLEIICNEFPQLNSAICADWVTKVGDGLKIWEFEDKGFLAYVLFPNFLGKLELSEIFLYLEPEHRNLRNLNRMLDGIEKLAIELGCETIKIGANSGYSDERFIKYLTRNGYSVDTVKKEL